MHRTVTVDSRTHIISYPKLGSFPANGSSVPRATTTTSSSLHDAVKYKVDKVYDRVSAAASRKISMYKLSGGFNPHLQEREFFIVGPELVWFKVSAQ